MSFTSLCGRSSSRVRRRSCSSRCVARRGSKRRGSSRCRRRGRRRERSTKRAAPRAARMRAWRNRRDAPASDAGGLRLMGVRLPPPALTVRATKGGPPWPGATTTRSSFSRADEQAAARLSAPRHRSSAATGASKAARRSSPRGSATTIRVRADPDGAFKNCCRNGGRFRRRRPRVLLPRPLIHRLRSSADRAAGFDPARRGSTPLGGSGTVAERRGTRLQRAITAVRIRPVSSREEPPIGRLFVVQRRETP